MKQPDDTVYLHHILILFHDETYMLLLRKSM